ncbi:MAG: hypothetical protein ABI425_05820 [Patescibacteria group bacterium]
MTVFITNLSEDVWGFIQSIDDEKERTFEILENSFLSDRDLFSVCDIPDACFISPQPIDPDFFQYQTELTGAQNIQALAPKVHTGEVCIDCIKDKTLFKKLVKLGKTHGGLTLLPYSTTAQFFELVKALEKAGVSVQTPDSPPKEDLWTVNFLGSKAGIRQIVQKYQHLNHDLIMADGLICSGINEIAQIAAYKYVEENGVVIKTNKGHSGAGVLIYAPDELPREYDQCVKKIKHALNLDEYWNIFPVVVESYIKPNFSIGGGFPNFECRIHENGKVEILYNCGMRMSDQGVFLGVEIQKEILPKKTQQIFHKIGRLLGKVYTQLGYRGYFDVDFIAGTDGKLYLTESNVRRTGGTYAYEAARKLIGKNFMTKSYFATRSAYPLPTKKLLKFNKVKKLLEPVLFDHKTKEGVVLTTANVFRQHKIAYIVFGKDKPRALAIEEKMHKLLKKL